MQKRSAVVIVLLGMWVLGGCAVGQSHTFNYVPAERSEIGKGRVVMLFAVDDKRSYVVSGEEPATFVGEQRSGYGIPFNVTTSDKRPFATIVQETVQRDLEAAGFRVTASQEKPANLAAAAKSANARRALSVVINEFKSDTYTNISVHHDFEVIVYDAGGKELARDRISGEDVLPGSMLNPVKAAKQKVPGHFYEKIHALVTGNPKVVKALTN